jgi:hypothetical protein
MTRTQQFTLPDVRFLAGGALLHTIAALQPPDGWGHFYDRQAKGVAESPFYTNTAVGFCSVKALARRVHAIRLKAMQVPPLTYL